LAEMHGQGATFAMGAHFLRCEVVVTVWSEGRGLFKGWKKVRDLKKGKGKSDPVKKKKTPRDNYEWREKGAGQWGIFGLGSAQLEEKRQGGKNTANEIRGSFR